MVRCVPYFKDKGDSNSSAGWKGVKAEVNVSDVVMKAYMTFPLIQIRGIRVDVMCPRIGDAYTIELVHIAESIASIGRLLL
ncbi:hypothetical protein WISP_35599 [Willisornis vidua]|uniref:Uncharacterized protein n=1 Tax=Willisornis vidua TaxID=1566151 RepID=A0ABQ9DIN9_9PASS|nr:hypothetical protein WISP_35599 [Willisornis vidua]